MNKEIETKFFIENKDEIRKKLSSLNFNLVKKEFLMKRKTFDSEANGKWFRVRDEGDKITMTYKNIIDKTINGVNEIEIIVNDFDKASEMLNQTNFKERSYQENFREVWSNQDAEIVIDTWPFLQTYIEIEALSASGQYNPWDIYNSDYRIKNIMDSLFNGPWVGYKQDKFRMIFDEIMYHNDVYFILKDFDAYQRGQEKISNLYKDRQNWNKMSLINIASSGFFSSDRTIEQYVKDIWHLEKIH